MLGIKKYSKLNKETLEKKVSIELSVIKIQKSIRKFLSRGENCPISLDIIKYPCFPYKLGNKLIYYNNKSIKDYILSTGDFRDPTSRTNFTEKDLKTIDDIDLFYLDKTGNKKIYVSVLKASKNKNYYKKIKEREYELLILERTIDEILQDMINLIEMNASIDVMFVLTTLYLHDFGEYIKRIFSRSKEHCKYILDKNIVIFEKLINNFESIKQQKEIEYIILYIYQLKNDLNIRN